jgi:hypothetical protein
MPADSPAPLRPRLKLLLAAALAAGSILLPLSPVWRHAGDEIDALTAERALLDPLARAVAVQRSLLGHGDVAARVLRGRSALEAERRLRQHAVEADLLGLQATLSAGLWTRALGEAHALTQDWRTLSWQVAQRTIAEARSREGHQLLIEQAVLVMDLVSSAAPADAALRLALRSPDRAALEALLLARERAVATRLAEARQARALAVAGGLAALAALLALARGLLSQAPPPAPQSPEPRDDVRRSHGRRRTDFAGFDSALPWTGAGELPLPHGREAATGSSPGPRRPEDDA